MGTLLVLHDRPQELWKSMIPKSDIGPALFLRGSGAVERGLGLAIIPVRRN
jgi:hypothetical protein